MTAPTGTEQLQPYPGHHLGVIPAHNSLCRCNVHESDPCAHPHIKKPQIRNYGGFEEQENSSIHRSNQECATDIQVSWILGLNSINGWRVPTYLWGIG